MLNNLKRNISCILCATIILTMLLVGCSSAGTKISGQNSDGNSQESSTEETKEEGLQFPYVIEGAGITVNSLFTSTIPNPDCGGEMGEDIASLEIANTSGMYIKEAEITVILEDGSSLNFKATNIPEGRTADVFSLDNTGLNIEVVCKEITCHTTCKKNVSLMEDKISISTESVNISLDNQTDQELNDLVLYCHTSIDNIIFGGTTYQYTVDNIPSNGKASVEATDCYLGDAEIVRIEEK